MPTGSRLIRFVAEFHACLFPCSRSIFPVDRPLMLDASGSSFRFVVSYRVPSFQHPLLIFRCEALPTGVWSLFAASLAASTRREDSQPLATFRPQAFSASRRFTPPPAARAYFIPKPRTGFILSRGFSLHAAPPSSSEGVAPVPLKNFTLSTRR
jgi:hypothetical protein